MTDLRVSDDVRIELSYVLDTKEIGNVKAILDTQLPGYELVEDVIGTRTILDVPKRDVSPPLIELRKGLPTFHSEPKEFECPVPTQTAYTRASDLRLYLVQRTSPDEDQTPRSVVIDYGAGDVVAFG